MNIPMIKLNGLNKASSYLVFLSIVVLSLIFSISFYTYSRFHALIGDAEMINELGIIRGSIQRATKTAYYGNIKANAEASRKINILFKKYNLNINSPNEKLYPIQYNLKKLHGLWKELDQLLKRYLISKNKKTKDKIEPLSETAWVVSSHLVSDAQKLAEYDSENPAVLYILMFVNAFFVIVAIFFSVMIVRRKLEYEVAHDSLTKVKNRRSFDEQMACETTRSNRYDSPLSLVLFDIDHFKSINDKYGHPAGDRILKELCEVIRDSVRKCDKIFRIGGEEFSIIAPNSDERGATRLAEHIRTNVEGHDFSLPIKITISIGISTYDQKGSPSQLYRQADIALYNAKHGGRNRVEYYS